MNELHDEVENEVVEEALDLKNAEQQSIDSVAKAAKGGPTAKKRKGDQDNGEKAIPSMTKAKMITAMVNKMDKMSKTEMTKLYSGMNEALGLEDEEVLEAVDASAELDTIMADEATLSEEFKEKTSVIFEAALRSKLSEEVNRLEESYQQELAEEIQATKDDMVTKIDSYLNYVVESWMEDNKLAIEQGIRTEIAEGFMSKLKDLFTESYIEVPESKIDLVDSLAEENADLTEQYNEAVEKSMELTEMVKDLKKQAVIAEHSKDLVDTQAEKLNALVEDIEYDEESFSNKVATIKESFFKKEATEESSNKDLSESVETEGEVEEAEVSGAMAHYLKHLKK